MPSKDHYVIIGNGPAGNHAAATLRKKDAEALVTIISDECVPYYYKPKLTGYISGSISRDDLIVNPLEFYAQSRIRARLGQKVLKIDTETNSLVLDHQEQIQYTALVIASGSHARVLPDMERFAEHLKFVTCYDDVLEYADRIKKEKAFFIFGGDLVGFKFARMLDKMGKKVTVMMYPKAFWPYQLTDEMTDQIVKSLSSENVSIIVRDDIEDLRRVKGQYRISTARGKKVTADLVFSFNGMIPVTDFAKGTDIDIDHGILVDEYLKTSVNNVWACGSCAQIYNPSIKAYTTTIGWPNAVTQGEVAALNLLGDTRKVESVGRKYFDLEGVKIKTTWWKDIDPE